MSSDEKRQLISVPFSTSKEATTGEPRVISDRVGFQPSTYWGAFTVAENGVLIYDPNTQTASSLLTWYDRNGKEVGHLGEAGVLANPSISPSGDRVTVDITCKPRMLMSGLSASKVVVMRVSPSIRPRR
jgi:hypothetical protein